MGALCDLGHLEPAPVGKGEREESAGRVVSLPRDPHDCPTFPVKIIAIAGS